MALTSVIILNLDDLQAVGADDREIAAGHVHVDPFVVRDVTPAGGARIARRADLMDARPGNVPGRVRHQPVDGFTHA